jgi:hypothetical protein
VATIDYVADWAARLRSRLYTQFRDATTWQQWCDEVLGPQLQDLEDAGQTLLTLLDIDESEGAQLDNIGRIVGQPRNGIDDETYRLYLSARILANKSTGTVDDIFKVMRALFGQDEARPTYAGGWVKQFVIKVGAILTRAEALIATDFLSDSKEAGARGLLEWSEAAPTGTFTMWDGPVLATGIVAGQSFQHVWVTQATGFTTSAYLGFGGGPNPYNPLFFYSSNSASHFFGAGVVSIYNMAPGTPVSPAALATAGWTGGGVTGVGLDYGDFAGAKQA